MFQTCEISVPLKDIQQKKTKKSKTVEH